MTANLLSTFAENAGIGGFTFILGMVVIFFGMIILVLAVSLVGKIVSGAEEKKNATPVKEERKEIAQPVVSETVGDIPEDVKVAIIAAVTAYYTESGAKNEFTVRKIKKI